TLLGRGQRAFRLPQPLPQRLGLPLRGRETLVAVGDLPPRPGEFRLERLDALRHAGGLAPGRFQILGRLPLRVVERVLQDPPLLVPLPGAGLELLPETARLVAGGLEFAAG